MTFDTVDAVVAWPKVPYHNRLKAYFFRRSEYLRYDIELDRQDFGYPKPIGPNWPGLPNNIDAALVWPVKVDGKRRAYFFSGDKYTRWNIDDNVVDPNYPKPIVGNWNNWPTHWTRVDAALEWDDERVYLFHRGEYVRYSVEDGAVVGKERHIDGAWPGLPTSGIQAASKWPAVEWNDHREKAYFFWGTKYFRYDIDREAPDGGFPRTIRDTWPGADLAVWAAAFDVPIVPCLDARLEGKPGGPPYPQGTLRGQGGWDMGLLFTSLNDLAVKIVGVTPKHIGAEPLQPGQITRLAINAHGSEHGEVALNGRSNANVLDVNTVDDPANRNKLDQIGRMVAQPGIILFMGCKIGLNESFVIKLSNIWPGRRVVGFRRTGYSHDVRQRRKYESCMEVGMRLTDYVMHSQQKEAENERKWNDLAGFPWAWEGLPEVVTALDGKIV